MRVLNTAQLPAAMDADTQLWVYNGLDAMVTHEVYRILDEYMDDNSRLVYQFTRGMQGPALAMALRGFRIDTEKKAELIHLYEGRLSRLSAMLQRLALEVYGVALNPKSPIQLAQFFYGLMRLPVQYQFDKKTRERKPTTNRKALEKLGEYREAKLFVAIILKTRDVERKLSVLKSGVDRDGRMRCTYSVVGTETGRWSSYKNAFGTGTNLQNITDEMREMFVPDPGWKLGGVDLEQAESRLVAYLANDQAYIDACEGGDLHTTSAKLIWPELAWTGDNKKDREIAEQPFYRHFSYRDMSKRGGHASNYRGTAFVVAMHLAIDLDIAEQFQARYFGAFRGIPIWHNWVAREIQSKRHLVTPLGRRIWFFGRVEDDKVVKEAIAAAPQSSIGDTLNVGLYRLWRGHDARIPILAQVHDAIYYQFREDDNEAEVHDIVKACCRVVLTINGKSMTIPVECKSGWNWRNRIEKKNPNTGEISIINPHGLAKFKNAETREPPVRPTKFSILDRRIYSRD